MKSLRPALWTETLKARRSRLPLLTALGISLAPIVGGLFMIILEDPVRARDMGLISAKAQLTFGVADWPTYFGFLAQSTAIGGAIVFAIAAIWIFGREFSDHTAKELLALPVSREAIVAAKFIVLSFWILSLTLLIFGLGLIVGALITIPGWSLGLLRSSFAVVLVSAALTLALMPFVAFFASLGRGYLPPFGWAMLTVFLAQIVAATGWGDWFPWSVPALFSGAAGPRAALLGPHSYWIVAVAALLGLSATFWWWRSADQTR